jgi:hypothetical protein
VFSLLLTSSPLQPSILLLIAATVIALLIAVNTAIAAVTATAADAADTFTMLVPKGDFFEQPLPYLLF